MMSSIVKILLLLSLMNNCSCYNHDQAKRFSAYSYLSYCNPARLANWDVGDYPGVTQVTVVQSKSADVLAYLAYLPADNAILVSFRGTANMLNWISNIKMGWLDFVPACNCKVHNGFYGDYKLIQVQVKNQLDQYMNNHKGSKIYVIGHSLGGAMATLFTADLHDKGYKVDFLQTIGSPRVGDQNFINWFDIAVKTTTEYYRITHAHDPVPHLPQIFFNYVHVDSEIYYADANFKQCRSGGEDPDCSVNVQYNILKTEDHSTYLGLDSVKISSLCS